MERDTELTVAGLAHDLNNVFETLAESAELLGRDPKWARLAGTIRRCVTRGGRIVESLSETARDSETCKASWTTRSSMPTTSYR